MGRGALRVRRPSSTTAISALRFFSSPPGNVSEPTGGQSCTVVSAANSEASATGSSVAPAATASGTSEGLGRRNTAPAVPRRVTLLVSRSSRRQTYSPSPMRTVPPAPPKAAKAARIGVSSEPLWPPEPSWLTVTVGNSGAWAAATPQSISIATSAVRVFRAIRTIPPEHHGLPGAVHRRRWAPLGMEECRAWQRTSQGDDVTPEVTT